jgi:hypothetical protein
MRRTPHKSGLFPDVVSAYKGLIKEKEALEASLKALTVSSTSDKSYGPGNKTSSDETENEEIIANSAFTSGVEVIERIYKNSPECYGRHKINMTVTVKYC